MSKELMALLFVGLVATGSGLCAQAPPASGQIVAGARAPAAGTPPAATTLSVRGTIDKYDRLTRMLVLTTPAGTVQFPIVSTTRIRRGWRKVDPADLPALAGARATVRYTESGGDKTVESVHVFGQ